MSTTSTPRYRPLTFGVTRVVVRDGDAGVRYVQAEQALAPFAHRITDRLVYWAHTAPDRVWMARRERRPDGSTGDWRCISYAQALQRARNIGQALIDRSLSDERPVAILSENDLEHGLLALGCIYAGVPYCSVSPAYSTVSTDFEKLRHVLRTITPGLVFASDLARYGKAISATLGMDTEITTPLPDVTAIGQPRITPFEALLATPAGSAVDAAMRATGPDTIVKFLFTSGSTKLPRAVINTQRMWCANQQQMRQSMPVLATEIEGTHPVLVDWLPWNHTFGGNHNFGLVSTTAAACTSTTANRFRR